MLLNPRRRRFCEEYLVDSNATAAYKRAGYASKGHAAEANAQRLMRNDEVRREIRRLRLARSRRVRLTADEVLLQLRRLVLVDIRRLFHPDGRPKAPGEWDDDTAAAVASYEVEEHPALGGRDQPAGIVRTTKVRLWSVPRALGLAMDHLGLSNHLTLETVLTILPGPVATALRRAIGEGSGIGQSLGPARGFGDLCPCCCRPFADTI
jgi:phage terminase small subunit